MCRLFLLFSLLLSGLSYASWVDEGQLRFEINSQHLKEGAAIELNGDWLFSFGEHIPPEQVPSRIIEQGMHLIKVPSAWNYKAQQLTDNPHQHGKATYVLPLTLSSPIDFPIILHASLITSTYRMYWLEDGATQAYHVGAAGQSLDGREVGKGIDYYHLPLQHRGALIVHVSKHEMYKGGIRHPVTLQRSDVFFKANSLNLFVTSMLIGCMFILCLHYLIQYRYSSMNVSALYLSILCFMAAIRSLITSGYFDLIMQGVTDHYLYVSIKLEYITVFLIPISYFTFISSLFNELTNPRVTRYAVTFGLLGVLVTVLLPIELMTRNLVTYQMILGIWAVLNLGLVLQAVYKRLKFARQVLFSVLVVLAGALNDIIASHSNTYNFFVSSFVFFIFLFIQALIVGQQLRESMSQAVRLSDEKLQLQKAHVKALMESQLDHLTGLYNRLACAEKINQLERIDAKTTRFVGVIMLDIDHFKRINDAYGHDVGDEILIFVASMLHGFQLRNHDFKCRYGGEEFLILLPGATLERTEAVAEALRSDLEKEIAYKGDELVIKITASFGVAVQDKQSMKSLKDVILEADQALYRAKKGGRNQVSV